MARTGDPDSAGSQFFIMLNDAPFLDGKYTIFGEVIQGLDVLDKIGSVPVTFSSFNEKSRPIMSMELEKVIYLSQPLEKKDGGNKQESMLDKIKENSGAGKVPGDKKSAGINDARKKPVESKPKDIKK
jgi:cyclophilin family peptidyl-prolyl cis-trans isomerase